MNPVARVRAGQRSGNLGRQSRDLGSFLRIQVDRDVAVPDDPMQTAAELFNLTVSEVAILGGRQSTVSSEAYRNLTFRPDVTNNALQVVNEGSTSSSSTATGWRRCQSLHAGLAPAQRNGQRHPHDAGHPPATGTTFNIKVNGGANIPMTLDYGGAAPTTYPGLLPFLQAAIQAQATSIPCSRTSSSV